MLNSARMKFSLRINMKMPTVVGIFIFICRENFHAQLGLPRKNLQLLLRFICRTNLMLSRVEHEKSFLDSGHGLLAKANRV